jgi:hypothetical protein
VARAPSPYRENLIVQDVKPTNQTNKQTKYKHTLQHGVLIDPHQSIHSRRFMHENAARASEVTLLTKLSVQLIFVPIRTGSAQVKSANVCRLCSVLSESVSYELELTFLELACTTWSHTDGNTNTCTSSSKICIYGSYYVPCATSDTYSEGGSLQSVCS